MPNISRRSERGEGRIGLIFWLLLTIAVGTFAWQYIPARIQKAEIKDFVVEQTKSAGKATIKQLNNAIVSEADRMGIEIKKGDIEIEKKGGRVKIDYTYTKELVFPGYTHVFVVTETVDRPFYRF